MFDIVPDVQAAFFYAPFPYEALSLLMFLCFWIILTLDKHDKEYFIPAIMTEFLLLGTISFFMLTFHKFDNTPIMVLNKYSAMHGSVAMFAMTTALIVGGLLAVSIMLVLLTLSGKAVIRIFK